MNIEISDAQHDLLLEVLDREARELRSENYHAESHAVKELLKAREALVRGLLAALRQESGSATGQ